MSAQEWAWDLVDLSAAQAARDSAGMEAALTQLKAAGRETEVEEAILQSYLFLGFPAAIESFRRWRTHGVRAPEPTDEGPRLWERRGVEMCRIVYGDHYESLRENISQLHPDLDRWMVMEGYGKVLGRPALSLDVREMLIVAMLVVLGARRQLRSHLRGALNAGVTPDDVDRVIQRAASFAPAENVDLAGKLWSVILDQK